MSHPAFADGGRFCEEYNAVIYPEKTGHDRCPHCHSEVDE